MGVHLSYATAETSPCLTSASLLMGSNRCWMPKRCLPSRAAVLCILLQGSSTTQLIALPALLRRRWPGSWQTTDGFRRPPTRKRPWCGEMLSGASPHRMSVPSSWDCLQRALTVCLENLPWSASAKTAWLATGSICSLSWPYSASCPTFWMRSFNTHWWMWKSSAWSPVSSIRSGNLADWIISRAWLTPEPSWDSCQRCFRSAFSLRSSWQTSNGAWPIATFRPCRATWHGVGSEACPRMTLDHSPWGARRGRGSTAVSQGNAILLTQLVAWTTCYRLDWVSTWLHRPSSPLHSGQLNGPNMMWFSQSRLSARGANSSRPLHPSCAASFNPWPRPSNHWRMISMPGEWRVLTVWPLPNAQVLWPWWPFCCVGQTASKLSVLFVATPLWARSTRRGSFDRWPHVRSTHSIRGWNTPMRW